MHDSAGDTDGSYGNLPLAFIIYEGSENCPCDQRSAEGPLPTTVVHFKT